MSIKKKKQNVDSKTWQLLPLVTFRFPPPQPKLATHVQPTAPIGYFPDFCRNLPVLMVIFNYCGNETRSPSTWSSSARLLRNRLELGERSVRLDDTQGLPNDPNEINAANLPWWIREALACRQIMGRRCTMHALHFFLHHPTGRLLLANNVSLSQMMCWSAVAIVTSYFDRKCDYVATDVFSALLDNEKRNCHKLSIVNV